MTDLLTVAQAAVLLDTHPRNVRRWCANGHLEATRFGKRAWMIPPEAVAEFQPPRRGRPTDKERAEKAVKDILGVELAENRAAVDAAERTE